MDLNAADETALLQVMKGLTERDASAIVSYRAQHGKFKTVAELVNVGVIPPRVINRHMRAWLSHVAVILPD